MLQGYLVLSIVHFVHVYFALIVLQAKFPVQHFLAYNYLYINIYQAIPTHVALHLSRKH